MSTYDSAMLSEIINRVMAEIGGGETKTEDALVPVGVSNRHIHLTQEHVETLFGKGYACKEQLTIIGPSLRPIEGVRVLGPVRKSSQVEISRTDSFVLKVKPPVRESGDIAGSAPITIIGPKGVVTLKEGCIIANRHIHMSLDDAAKFGVKDGDYVTVEANGERRTTFYDVQIRANAAFRLEMHIDTDDANAAAIGNGFKVKLVK